MAEILLPGRYSAVTLVDDDQVHMLHGRKWCILKDQNTSYVRGYRAQDDSRVYLHRILMGAGPGQIVDHINGNGLDNRRANLRLCSKTENQQNRRVDSKNTSGFKGVYWDRQCHVWRARIYADNRVYMIGRYGAALEAARAYDRAAIEFHGQFARTNAAMGLY